MSNLPSSYHYKEWDVVINLSHYADELKRPAIVLSAADSPLNSERGVSSGSPIATATVNLPETSIPPNYTFIKDYSENEGMLDFLVSNGFVFDTGITFPAGFTEVPLVEINQHAPFMRDF